MTRTVLNPKNLLQLGLGLDLGFAAVAGFVKKFSRFWFSY